jgi:cell division protein FtsN
MLATPRSLSLQRQRGNTLTGIIIGLIVGLAIAVAVALSITKGASPFTDKGVKSGRPADPAPGQALDPNKPMYGNREAARQANRELTEKSGERAAASPAPAAPAAEADPLGAAIAGMKDTGEARPEPRRAAPAPAATVATAAPAAAPAAASDDGVVYYLQAGAFREMSDAEATRAKLALLGFEAAISDRSSDSGVLHRVRMGPYSHQESMNKAKAKLLDNGIVVAIVRNQK